MTEEATSNPRICVDRIVPDAYNPARATAHRAAFSRYTATVHDRVQRELGKAAAKGTFGQHVEAIQRLPSLNAADPVFFARMALINQKKWEDGYTLRCRFLDGNSNQRTTAQKKGEIWEKYA